MHKKTLTEKQKKVYDFICGFVEKKSYSPTISELAEFLHVSSLRTVTQYLESLERKGLIIRTRNCSRGIRLAQQEFSSTVTLPIISAAGCDNLNVFAQESFSEYITLDRSFLLNKAPEKMVIFRALGESMVEAGIESGDLVLAEKTQDIKNKDKVVAVIDGKAVIKQVAFTPNAIILSPMSKNREYHPIIMKKDFQIFGKVIDVIKNFSNEELVYESC